MDKMKNASAMIFTREKYIGFPPGFKAVPEGMQTEIQRKFHLLATTALQELSPLRESHRFCRIAVAQDGYVVLGIAVYLRDLVGNGWEGTDGNRIIPGFLAFVWKQKDFRQDVSFPAMEEYRELFEEIILPHWEDSPNSRWAEEKVVIPFAREVSAEAFAGTDPGYAPDRQGKLFVEKKENARNLVSWAVGEAASGNSVSVCTNVTIYDAEDYDSPFRYVARADSGPSHTVLKRLEKEKTQQNIVETTEKPTGTYGVGNQRAEKGRDRKQGSTLEEDGRNKNLAILGGVVGIASVCFAAGKIFFFEEKINPIEAIIVIVLLAAGVIALFAGISGSRRSRDGNVSKKREQPSKEDRGPVQKPEVSKTAVTGESEKRQAELPQTENTRPGSLWSLELGDTVKQQSTRNKSESVSSTEKKKETGKEDIFSL